MTLTIGRIPAIVDPMQWRNTGDQVQLMGRLGAGSANAAFILRDQLLGYSLNPDEPVIPIISSADSRLTGFYRILGVDVPTTPTMFGASGVVEYNIQAERVLNFAGPSIESVITGALMTNALGITTTAEPFHAFGNSWEYTINVSGFTRETRSLADGSTSVDWVRMNPTAAAPTYKALARFTMSPANYYNAACEIRNPTPSDHVVVGQQEAVPANTWTLRNGLVSLTVGAGFWPLTWADNTNTYRTTALMDIKGTATVGSFVAAATGYAKIIRNAPEECILRVPVSGTALGGWPPSNTTGAIDYSPAYIDISIRRGSRIVRFYLVAQIAESYTWGNRVAVASTAITGGNVWTANDANSNRVGIFSSIATTNDLANGRITRTATGTTWDFGVTLELAGTGSTNRDTIASQVLQYLSAQAERQQVIAR